MGQQRLSKEQRRSIKSARRVSKNYAEGGKVYRAAKQNWDEFSYSNVYPETHNSQPIHRS